MAKSEKTALLVVTLLLCVMLFVIIVRANTRNDGARVYRISVITDDSQGDYSQNTRKGLDRAARDYNVDLQIIAVHDGATSAQQADALTREMESGADAILLYLLHCPDLDPSAELSHITVPIVSLGAPFDSAYTACSVSSDDVAVGRMLAQTLLEDNVATCYVRSSYSNARIRKRFQGFKDTMTAAGVHCTLEEDASAAAWTDIPSGAAVAALDEPSLEKLTRGALSGRVTLYGIGCTNELLNDLEDGLIRRLIVEDDYAMGYLAVQSAVESIEARNTVREHILTSYVADRAHLYSEPLQHVLFPIS